MNTKQNNEWEKRQELLKKIKNTLIGYGCVENVAEGTTRYYEMIIVDILSQSISSERQRLREEIRNWIEDPKNISVGQSGDFRDGDIVVLKRHLLKLLE